MSTLFVNNLNTASGSTITVPTGKVVVGTDAGTFKQPGNSIQLVRNQVNQGSHANSDSTSFFTIGNSVVTITPKYSNSLIRLVFSMYLHIQTGSPYYAYTVFRAISGGGTTNLGLASGSQIGMIAEGADTTDNGYQRFHLELYDAPSTTSATTYTLQFKRTSGSNGLYAHSGGRNEFIAEEIAQ
tara:strand:- start:637 stop:1188 length:552 start_codon:yes stop_codon:yes gene_type:complete